MEKGRESPCIALFLFLFLQTRLRRLRGDVQTRYQRAEVQKKLAADKTMRDSLHKRLSEAELLQRLPTETSPALADGLTWMFAQELNFPSGLLMEIRLHR